MKSTLFLASLMLLGSNIASATVSDLASAKGKLLIAKYDVYLGPHERIHPISRRCHLKTGDEDRFYRVLEAGRSWEIERALELRDYAGIWLEPSSLVGIFCDPSVNTIDELKSEIRTLFVIK